MDEYIVHVAGAVVSLDGRVIQRCAVCGLKMFDNKYHGVCPWPPGGYIDLQVLDDDRISGSMVGNIAEGRIPTNNCLVLVE